jgi:hypothetical protein
MEIWMALIITALVGMLGGILHIVVPPIETDRIAWLRRIIAGFVVGIILFLGGADPSKFELPSLGIALWFGTVMASGYTAIDILKIIIDKYKPATPAAATDKTDDATTEEKTKLEDKKTTEDKKPVEDKPVDKATDDKKPDDKKDVGK